MVKVVRVFEFLRFVAKLRLIIDYVRDFLTNLFWCLVLIIMVLFLFALLLVQILTQDMPEHMGGQELAHVPPDMQEITQLFRSVGTAMLILPLYAVR